MTKLEPVQLDVSSADVEALRELLRIEHEHYDGMNECSICDEPLITAAIKELKKYITASSDKSDLCPCCSQGWNTAKNEQLYRAESHKLQERIKELEAVLVFYAHPSAWLDGVNIVDGYVESTEPSHALQDKGQRAREVTKP